MLSQKGTQGLFQMLLLPLAIWIVQFSVSLTLTLRIEVQKADLGVLPWAFYLST